MSLRNRARKLQRHTTLTYQQALAKLKALGSRPAALARKTGWALDTCDRYLVDGRAPIVVQEAILPFGQPTSLDAVCEELLRATNAREVRIVDDDGRELARALVDPATSPPIDERAEISLPLGMRAHTNVVFDARERRLTVRVITRKFGTRLLVELRKLRGRLAEREWLAHASRQYGVPSVGLDDFALDDIVADVLALVPFSLAQRHDLLPLARNGNTLVVAMSDPSNRHAIEDIQLRTGLTVEVVVASRRLILAALAHLRDRF